MVVGRGAPAGGTGTTDSLAPWPPSCSHPPDSCGGSTNFGSRHGDTAMTVARRRARPARRPTGRRSRPDCPSPRRTTGGRTPAALVAAVAGPRTGACCWCARAGSGSPGSSGGDGRAQDRAAARAGPHQSRGQSQQRFARRRDNQARQAYEAAAEHAARILRRCAAGGPGGDRPAVEEVLADRAPGPARRGGPWLPYPIPSGPCWSRRSSTPRPRSASRSRTPEGLRCDPQTPLGRYLMFSVKRAQRSALVAVAAPLLALVATLVPATTTGADASPATVAVAAKKPKPDTRDILVRIREVPGVAAVTEATAPAGYRFFRIQFTQPVDQRRPRGGDLRAADHPAAQGHLAPDGDVHQRLQRLRRTRAGQRADADRRRQPDQHGVPLLRPVAAGDRRLAATAHDLAGRHRPAPHHRGVQADLRRELADHRRLEGRHDRDVPPPLLPARRAGHGGRTSRRTTSSTPTTSTTTSSTGSAPTRRAATRSPPYSAGSSVRTAPGSPHAPTRRRPLSATPGTSSVASRSAWSRRSWTCTSRSGSTPSRPTAPRCRSRPRPPTRRSGPSSSRSHP